MKKYTKRIIFAILIIINCMSIFLFSQQVGEDSGNTSSKIVEIVSQIIPFIKNMQEPEKTMFKENILSQIVRKCAHFSIYTMLGFFTINFMLTYQKGSLLKKSSISLLFGICYAISDEFHQMFIPGRSAEVRDVLIDSLGVLIGILFMIIIVKIAKRRKQRNDS